MTEDYIELSEFLEFKTKLNNILKQFGDRLRTLEDENKQLRAELSLKSKEKPKNSQELEDEEILKAVAGSNGLVAAGEKLGVTQTYLKGFLEKYAHYKYYGEKWNRGAKRALGIEVTPHNHPENVKEKSARYWAASVKSKGLTETAKESGVSPNALGLYLHMEGFDVKPAMKKEDWMKAAKSFLDKE